MKTQSKNKVLTTENLSIGYRTKKAHHIVASDFDLSIEKGKLVTVLGKNGIESIVEIELDAAELSQLKTSAEGVKATNTLLNDLDL